MACFALPYPWSRFASFGYLMLAAVLISGLSSLQYDISSVRRLSGAYPLLGITAVVFWILWTFAPIDMRTTGLPVIVLWTAFGGWSAILLIQMLAHDLRVKGSTLKGALAGYLILGLAAGLLLCGLETMQPGSFAGVDLQPAESQEGATVWGLNFAKLNYFAFVSLTTMGYGDITPKTSVASMACVMIAIAGNFYIATVMGLLISRLTAQVGSDSGE